MNSTVLPAGRKSLSAMRAAVRLALVSLFPALACAQSASTTSSPEGWESSFSIYAYLPSIGGSTTFPVDSGGTINVTASKILDVLKMTFMGTYELHKGRWGFMTDLVYVDLGNSKPGSRDFTIGSVGLPAGTSSDLNWDYKTTAWTLAGQYRMRADSAWTVDLLGGARLLDQRQRLSWSITGSLGPLTPAARTGTAKVQESVWDAIVGIKGRYEFGASHQWAVPFYADVGAGESDSTLQVATGVSHAFGWGELHALWRYLDYNFKSGGAIKDMNFNGPQVGAVFRW